jgi:hypothetical protein
MDDWLNDLQWAQDHDLIAKDAKELNYDAFFKSIYELVDMWTETAEEEEYVSMIRRLIQGVTTSADGNKGTLSWRKDADIKFDTYFSFTGKDEISPTAAGLAELEEGDEDDDDGDDEEEGGGVGEKGMVPGMPYEGEFEASGEDNRPSVLEVMAKKPKKRKNAKAPMSAAKVMARIAAIFQAKQQAVSHSKFA